ncbi:MAG: guanylate kinase [Flexilinea sp.]|nr:guanylate kinase [Flexilinea sp.]
MGTESLQFSFDKPQPLILVISGLSGSGKDAVIQRLDEITDVEFHFVVTCNTRKRRETEIDGKDYHFITREKFLSMIENGEMIEHSVVYDDLKGVPRFEIENAFEIGQDIILRLDSQGMQKIKAIYPQTISIFILPPDAESWLARLRARNTETEESLNIRIQTAAKELAGVSQFDYIVVNDQIDQAAMDILTILKAEHMRSSNRKVITE